VEREKEAMMKQIVVALALAGCCVTGAQAQTGGAPKAAPTMMEPSKSFDGTLSLLEKEFMGVAKAMPAEKYNFAPSAAIFAESQKTDYLSPDNKGVRTFAENVKHVAQANYFFAGMVGGMKPDVDVKAIGDLKDKDQIVAAVQGSFDFAHKAMATLTTQNAFESVTFKALGPDATRASVAGFLVAHGFDHFGHISEYLRMNGLIPPSSQK
jgi:uncharacterized damage-inducible protein DinB